MIDKALYPDDQDMRKPEKPQASKLDKYSDIEPP
jgi:hypothetical protein